MARKSWDELSPSYRARLERKGITREAHASGTSLQRARGHGNTEILTLFRRNKGYSHVNVKEFEKMPRESQAFIADMFNRGFMKQGLSTQADRDARNAFLGWKLLNDSPWDLEDWKKYRQEYTVKFGK